MSTFPGDKNGHNNENNDKTRNEDDQQLFYRGSVFSNRSRERSRGGGGSRGGDSKRLIHRRIEDIAGGAAKLGDFGGGSVKDDLDRTCRGWGKGK